jgi:hypothetical protein
MAANFSWLIYRRFFEPDVFSDRLLIKLFLNWETWNNSAVRIADLRTKIQTLDYYYIKKEYYPLERDF